MFPLSRLDKLGSPSFSEIMSGVFRDWLSRISPLRSQVELDFRDQGVHGHFLAKKVSLGESRDFLPLQDSQERLDFPSLILLCLKVR